MEKLHLYTYSFFFFFLFSLSLITFVFCVLAEFKKSKINDVKLDGRLCQLPESEAFWYGIAALICLSIAQIVGNSIFFVGNCPDSKQRRSCGQPKMPIIASIFLLISWMSFGVTIILIGTATSMNRRQVYGKGWVDGECYLVKDGVFISAAILVLVNFGSTFTSTFLMLRKTHHRFVDQIPNKAGHPTGIT